MRFTTPAPQSEIDQFLRKAPSRSAGDPPLPWGPAIIGLSLLVLMQGLF
ncbi:hypothetical protein [Pseudorhodobacter aquimaris]|nr:hypothetical protein [Pseudorhodobacter aquimaris]